MTTATARKQASPEKARRIQLVHIAKAQLALTDDSYRDLLENVTGKRSSKSCTIAQLNDVLDRFKELGWKPKPRRKPGDRKPADHAQAKKIRALWRALWNLGESRDDSEAALAAFTERMTRGREGRGVEALQWLDSEQADRVIRALRGWLERIGFRFPDADRRKAIEASREAAGLPPSPAGFADKVALLECQWKRIKDSGTMKFAFHAELGRWCAKQYGPAAPYFLSPEQADQAIEELGRWVRKVYGVAS